MAALVPSVALSDPTASPVAWYLLVWIMLALASNSMAQPSGRLCGASTRHRVYLCSSPLFCFADGLAILVRVLITTTHLRISPLRACRLAILSRADERHKSKRNGNHFFDDQLPVAEYESPPTSSIAAGPRWLFFLVGAGPAAIQLASFSGLPIIQALGLMFISSFAALELVTFLSTFKGECKTIPEVLGYNKVESVPIQDEFSLVKEAKSFLSTFEENRQATMKMLGKTKASGVLTENQETNSQELFILLSEFEESFDAHVNAPDSLDEPRISVKIQEARIKAYTTAFSVSKVNLDMISESLNHKEIEGVPVKELRTHINELSAFVSIFQKLLDIYLAKTKAEETLEPDIRSKTHKLFCLLERFEKILFINIFFVQVILLSSLTTQIWPLAISSLQTYFSTLIQRPDIGFRGRLLEFLYELFYSVLSTLIILLYIILVFISILSLWGVGRSFSRFFKSYRTMTLIYTLSSLFPYQANFPKLTVSYCFLLLLVQLYWLMEKICERWPGVAKTLLIDRRPWDVEKIEHLTADQRTGLDNMTGVIHLCAWFSFCIFFTNLVGFVLWVVFLYDSTGTVNPGWTYVLR